MPQRAGSAIVESIAAEFPKFTTDLLLIHGLWCTAAVWRKCMGYLAHRGWNCHALGLRGHGTATAPGPIGQVRIADHLSDLRALIEACDAPPVLVGHDLGGLLALHVTDAVRARVALAPLVPPPLGRGPQLVLSRWSARWSMLRSRQLPVPTGAAARAFFGVSVPGGVGADSGSLAREITRGNGVQPKPSAVPTLVLAGEHDAISAPADIRELATSISATLHQVQGAGHGMPWEAGWERRVGEVHRWLVQTLGESLLLPREEEE